jgi:predicted lysophospholipase L1 biosynthesis ABC-type transport system permease subunit
MALAATPDYFKTMGTPLLAGREFSDADRLGANSTVIVNEEFGRVSGLGLGVVGRTVDLPGGRRTIVGVVRDILLAGPTDRPQPHVYLPFDQLPTGPGFMTFVVRLRGNTRGDLPILRNALQQIDPTVPVHDVKTLDQLLTDHLARPQFYTTGSLVLAAFALLVSMIGLYGITSHAVTQRMKEIGIRIAIGAYPGSVRRRVILQGLRPVLIGASLGLVAVYFSAPLLAYLLPSARAAGPWDVLASTVVPTISGVLALWAATGRITRSDPVATLRAD